MDKGRAPKLYTIPVNRAFADALVAGLMRRHGPERTGDPTALARGLILLPNNRSVRAITDAFVRASGGALLLPRLVPIGDPELGEGVGAALDPADARPIPPAVGGTQRRMMLARLVAEQARAAGRPVEAADAVRLAGELARTLDQMLVEEVSPERLRELDRELSPELSEHWRRSLRLFEVILDRWPAELARVGLVDAAARRTAVLDQLGERWRARPPAGFVCAAGISDSAPAVARLLRVVAELPAGSVVMAGLGMGLGADEWEALGPHDADPATGRRGRCIETHPQFHLKQLLDRMGVGRAEVKTWRGGSDHDATAARGRAIANALAPADLTAEWASLRAEDRRLSGVSAAEFPDVAAEAQGIALALREVLETPGRTAALVTPDRALARRVAAHLVRWDVSIDDSAGRPLSLLPPGTVLLDLAEAAAQDFAPLPLLALLKHPLVRSGEGRLSWLEGVRVLDRALRGPRPAPGLDGVDAQLADRSDERTARVRIAAADWWRGARRCLEAVGRTYARGPQPLRELVACLREAAGALCGDALWAGPAGRCAAEFLAELEARADDGPARVDPLDMGPLLRTLLDETAVRPAQGGHPRLAIYGQIEARLQSADLMVLGGLNEGGWPGTPAPDPWLAPRIRQEIGLPGLDWRVGVAAHDFGQALGAPEVLMTRSRRDARGPALASRFWLRLEALAGERFERARDLEGWAAALDDPRDFRPAPRPAPTPPPELRPTAISVTEVDRLKADPYAFYARRVLGLSPLDAVDADPSAAWRGSAVHLILEQWWKEDRCAPDRLGDRARALMADVRTHPMVRALWQPRLMEAIDWVAKETAEKRAEGREVLSAEGTGSVEVAGVRLTGRYDRIDRLPDGALALVDYKTGQAPSTAAVREGFSLQLGMLGVIAERGGFEGVTGRAGGFEYWSFARGRDGFGHVQSPVDPEGRRDKIETARFTDIAAAEFGQAAGRWLTGREPFTAKLHPEYAPYAEYDQLMRRDEWYGRE